MDTHHYHWVWWVYGGRSGNDYTDTTYVDVIGDSYKDTLVHVQRLVPLNTKGGANSGAGYRLHQVVEHLPGACVGHGQQ